MFPYRRLAPGLVLLGVLAYCYLSPVQRASSQLARGDARYIQGRSQEAEVFYRRAAELNPTSFRPWQRLARCQVFSETRLAEAERNYRHALELAPDNIETLLLYAQLLYLDRRYHESRKVAFTVLSRQPASFEAMLRVADCEVNLNNIPAARRWHHKILSFNPHHHLSLLGLARLAVHEGKDEEAIRFYKECMGVSVRLDQQAMEALAELLLKHDRVDELDSLLYELTAKRAVLPKTAAKTKAMIATHFNAQGDNERAAQHLRALLEFTPNGELADKARRILEQLDR